MTDQNPIIDYYGKNYSEDDRLDAGIARWEFIRSKEIISRYLTSEPQVIVDVGGATGAYSFWLAELGHQVHLRDITPEHIEAARKKAEDRQHKPISMEVGDALALDFPDNSADIVLLMGPLYHLTESEERLKAIGEAFRVLKPGGVVLCVGISRFASMISGFTDRGFDYPEFEEIVDQDLIDGQHRNVTDGPFFTIAFFHHPNELMSEVSWAGFQFEGLIGIEGPVGLMSESSGWLDEQGIYYEKMLKYMRAVEEEPSLIGVSFHIMAVGRK
ncbi:MAG: class I SAM-dependent methyltransferase [Anaerolineae bacterium]|nr:class I SAM-dependent methyltransferase [Anaerolineae bacterium]